jgi:hypothetical protein
MREIDVDARAVRKRCFDTLAGTNGATQLLTIGAPF